jgi:tetratricopeptide (TPR) repeat protein
MIHPRTVLLVLASCAWGCSKEPEGGASYKPPISTSMRKEESSPPPASKPQAPSNATPSGAPETGPASRGGAPTSRPGSPADARLGLAQRAYDLSDYPRAESELRAALALEPQRHDIHVRLGIVLYKLQRWTDAVASLEKALELNPKILGDIQVLGHCYYELGRHDDALAIYKKVVAVNPNNREAWRGIGVTLERIGNYDEAEEALRKAVALKPDSEAFLLPLGRVLVRKKMYGAALPYLERAKTADPFNWEVEYELSRAYKALGDDAKAKASNERKEFLGRHQDAIRILKTKYLNNPHDVMTIVQLATRYDLLGDVARATEAWTRATNVSRDDVAVTVARACSMILTNNKAAAETLLRSRIQKRPNEPESWEALWYVRKERGDVKGAEEAAARVRQLLKRDPVAPDLPNLDAPESRAASAPAGDGDATSRPAQDR